MTTAPIRDGRIVRAGTICREESSLCRKQERSSTSSQHVADAQPKFVGTIAQLGGVGTTTVIALMVATFLRQDMRWVAYVPARSSRIFLPDLYAMHGSLDRFLVIPGQRWEESVWAADTLIRSGQFSLVVLEPPDEERLALGTLSRFQHMVRTYRSSLIIATEESQPLWSASVSIYGTPEMNMGANGIWRLRLNVGRSRTPMAPIAEDLEDVGGLSARTCR